MSSDVLYYNITLESSSTLNSGIVYGPETEPLNASAKANNNSPVLPDPSEYYGSVIRFSVPCAQIPLINFIVQTPILTAQDVNKGIGSFTLTYNNTTSIQSWHTFKPQLENIKVPSYPSTKQDFTSGYYFLYNYSWLVEIYNESLKNAFNDLVAKVSPALNNAKTPFFYYDTYSQQITLNVDKNFFDSSMVNPVKIYFNSVCMPFFNGFVYNLESYGSLTGTDCLFINTDFNTLNEKTINGSIYIQNTQEFVSLAYLSPLKNIIISTSMNIKSELFYISNPTSLQNNNYVNVITDFLPDLSTVGGQAGVGSFIFIYNAPSLYRIFEFNQRSPLYNIDLAIQWVDAFGNSYPVQLLKGTQATLKLMFIKKSVFKNLSISGTQVLPQGIIHNLRI